MGTRLARAGRPVALCAVLAAAGAPLALGAEGTRLDRAALTGKLVPIAGEETRSVDLVVPFARGSADLTEAARAQLDELAAALAGPALRPFAVGVHGHTDASGPADYNLELSRERAAAAVAYLVGRHGLDPARFRHEGYGETRLLDGLAPRSPAHRRVEIAVRAPPAAKAAGAGGGTEGDHATGEDGDVFVDEDGGAGGTGLRAIE